MRALPAGRDPTQPTLFDPVRAARASDPDTSKIAAERMRFRVGSHYAQILAALDGRGWQGATHRELSQLTRLDPVQADRRLCELDHMGLVARLQETRGNPPAHVHVRVEAVQGRAVLKRKQRTT